MFQREGRISGKSGKSIGYGSVWFWAAPWGGKAADPLRFSAALQKLAHQASFWSATAELSLLR